MEKIRELVTAFHGHVKEWGYGTLALVAASAVALILNNYIPPFWLVGPVDGLYTLDQFQVNLVKGVSFCLMNFATFFLLPAAVILPLTVIARKKNGGAGGFPARLRDTGLGWGEQTRYLWVFGAAYLIILPLLYWAARQEAYQSTYPFFSFARFGPGYLVFWWIFYGLYYIGVEYFFRGFLLFGLYPKIGSLSVLVAAIPYVMIHFTKPPSEALGSLFAGILLGYMALRSGSIWGGFLLHWIVGMSMDALSIFFGSGFMER